MAPVLPPVWDTILGNCSQGAALFAFFLVDPYQLQPVALFSAVAQVVFFLLQRPVVWIFFFWNFLQVFDVCWNVFY